MIQRSKLAEELRDYQIRSQRKYWVVLSCFSAKAQISTRIYKYAIEIARAARWLSKKAFLPSMRMLKKTIGAIDGTHIIAIVNRNLQNRYRNRKGFTSQNVIVAVSFDRQFVYVGSGWEGSAVDMRVLRWAIEEEGIDITWVNNMLMLLEGTRLHMSYITIVMPNFEMYLRGLSAYGKKGSKF
ncbi:hypothetical protein M5K25_014862 [Dendrobium thyrsiflorum]|uniref:DDE Tnp4 domain-containing protein n=1 Tax=Dendrobium thyrsiflorum TaxID=117978 RepID=A0ABD0UPL9_DENTH